MGKQEIKPNSRRRVLRLPALIAAVRQRQRIAILPLLV
jgi:hypothetical protein